MDRSNQEGDLEFDSMMGAIDEASGAPGEYAVIEREYVYAGSELAWTPDGILAWPPDDEEDEEDV